MAEIDSASRLNAVSRDKKSASVRQADVPTDFTPIDRNKKSAALRQKIGWCAVAFRFFSYLSKLLFSVYFNLCKAKKERSFFNKLKMVSYLFHQTFSTVCFSKSSVFLAI